MKTNVSPDELQKILTQTNQAAEHTQPSVRACPLCAEPILAAAIRCKHCGGSLDPEALLKARPASGRLTVGKVAFIALMVFGVFTAIAQWSEFSEGRMGPGLPAWNSFFAVAMAAILVGVRRRAEWGRSWAVGTSGLTLISYLFSVGVAVNKPMVNEGAVAFLLLGSAIAGLAWWCLRGTKEEFLQPSQADKK